jgi:DNA primase small subunit
MANVSEYSHYYDKLFPHNDLCRLLGRTWSAGEDLLKCREFALETHDGVYIRWQSVSSAEELRKLFLVKNVSKVHIGAIYDEQPSLRKKVVVNCVQRELVFDIDIDDNGNLGLNANDIDECDRAWRLIALGIAIVAVILEDKFGFVNMLTVYSGRRGAHLSVYDARACSLTDEERCAIVDYMQPKGEKQPSKYGSIMNDGFFGNLWEYQLLPFWLDHGLVARDDGGAGFLDNSTLKDDFLRLFGTHHTGLPQGLICMTPIGFWNALWKYSTEADGRFRAQKCVENRKCAEKSWLNSHKETCLKNAVMSYLWPRLDVNVSKARNHLAKSVFSVHPKTGRICLPILLSNPFKFDPTKCTRIDDIVSGNPQVVREFKMVVKAFSLFVDRLQESTSETWKPRAMPQIANFSLINKKRHYEEAGAHFLPRSNRISYNLKRVFVATSSICEPNKVQLSWHTSVYDERGTNETDGNVNVIQAGYFPQFREFRMFPYDAFHKGIKQAERSPNTDVVIAEAYVCVLLNPRFVDIDKATERLDNLREFMEESNYITSVNVAWKHERVATVLKDMVRPVWKIDKLYFN